MGNVGQSGRLVQDFAQLVKQGFKVALVGRVKASGLLRSGQAGAEQGGRMARVPAARRDAPQPEQTGRSKKAPMLWQNE